MIQQHIEDSLEKIRRIFEKAANKIESLNPGGKIPATALAEQIAKEEGMNGPQLYPTLLFLINKDYPGIQIKKGAQGGIYKLAAPVLKEETPLEIKDPESKD